MTVFRCFVEKKKPFAVEANGVRNELTKTLLLSGVEDVRVINRYDIENIDEEDWNNAVRNILSEPQVDDVYEETAPAASENEWVLAVEYLPGQFDQRADSASQCIQLSTMKQRPVVRTARLYYIKGTLSDEDKAKIRKTLINPVEARQAKLEKPATIQETYEKPELPEVLEGFTALDEEGLKAFLADHGLAMDLADITFLQGYFRDEEKRDPRITEIKVIDTYWSDHCRHTTFNTILENISIEDEDVKEMYDNYLEYRKVIYAGRKEKPVTLMDVGTIGAKILKKAGKLNDLDESEEINACSVKIKVDVDGEEQDWLLMFKNETHNHPTEIEPFGGAATCLGGAIRDPLSGRSYVYQAMRVTGAADPLTPIEDTLEGKLPQSKIVTTAAQGYSSNGNQIGLATGHVTEIYHPGYVAKRMEVGGVIAAAPSENVVREVPQPGDIVILLGGRTGRDGCGGATGSSKSHNVESLSKDGAEVQKGNAPEERKLQRLFRNAAATKLIKRCNDFGAGGVSVAIGELADGLHIDLNKVPKKYEGLDGTELAISESQERMAVVVAKEDVETFQALAAEENLESTVVAEVTEDPRMVMVLDGTEIVNISREFLNTNGAKRYADARIGTFEKKAVEADDRTFGQKMNALAEDLNICSQKGLVERFDSTIGAGTVLMPFGGKTQLTPAQAMAAKIPVLGGETDTASIMSWGFDPYEMEANPFVGAQESVISALAKIVAAGGSAKHAWMSFQEYFGHMYTDPNRWGLPLGALLGALKAQVELETAAIGGKDSMSGTFENIDVPPTLVAFAVSTAKASKVVSPEWKKAGNTVYVVKPDYDCHGQPDYQSVRDTFALVEKLVAEGKAASVWTLSNGGIAEGILKCSLGNQIGIRLAEGTDLNSLFDKCYGGFMIESAETLDLPVLGTLQERFKIRTDEGSVCLHCLQKKYEAKLQPVYPYTDVNPETEIAPISYETDKVAHASYTVEKPHVLIPVFPGTNCEWDTARAFERAGGEAEIFVIRNLSSSDIEESARAFAERIAHSQIIAIPGGFSGGDEPEGSAKFITAFFRNPQVKAAVTQLLDEREGLMCGICNGFQALIKLGLVPYGKIIDTDEHCPTLTFNTIGRHQSMIVRTRVASNKSPWLRYAKVGEIHNVAISHGEGRFVCEDGLLQQLIENGQVAEQYVDLDGNPTSDVRFNPNNSVMAIEGITSADGRIFGKMGHSERSGDDMYVNIPDHNLQDCIFKGAIDYFR